MSFLSSPFNVFAILVVGVVSYGWSILSAADANANANANSWSSTWINTFFVLYLILRIVGRIRVGVTKKLGIPIDSTKRRLGLLERWYVAHSRSRVHTGFSICMELETNSRAPSEDDVRQVLYRVARRLPWLRARLHRDGVTGVDTTSKIQQVNPPNGSIWGDDLYVSVMMGEFTAQDVCVRQVELSKDPSDGAGGGLRKLFEIEGSSVWHDEDPTQPLWRAVLVKWRGDSQHFGLMLSFHHLICDGLGATAVAQAVLEESNLSSQGQQLLPPSQLPPPMEDMTDTVPRISHLAIPVLLDIYPSLTSLLKPASWKGRSSPVMKSDRQSEMVCVSLFHNQDDVLALKTICGIKGITVNSVCVAALGQALASIVRTIPSHKSAAIKNDFVQLKIQVAVNERENCAISTTQLGCYISGPQVYMNVGLDGSVDDSALEFQDNLGDQVKQAAMDLGLCVFIREDWIDFVKKLRNEHNGIQDSIEFSNLGLVTLHSTEKWRVTNLWFSQGRRETGAAITVTLVSGPGGMNAVLSAFPHAVSKDVLHRVAEAWKSELKNQIS